MEIRPFTPADLDAVLDLSVSRMPHLTRAEMARTLTDPAVTFAPSLVAVDGRGEVVGRGFLASTPFLDDDRRMARIQVAHRIEGQGVASRLAAILREHLDPTVTAVVSSVLDDDAHSLAVAEHWGFQRVMHGIASALVFDDLPVPTVVPGVTFEVLDVTPPEQDAALDAFLLRADTAPEAAHGFRMRAAPLRESMNHQGTPVTVLARVGEQPVGLAAASVVGELMIMEYLCVDPDHRRRGIARALKERLHEGARARGARRVDTLNEEGNVAVRNLNARLGFQRVWGEYRVTWQR